MPTNLNVKVDRNIDLITACFVADLTGIVERNAMTPEQAISALATYPRWRKAILIQAERDLADFRVSKGRA